mmetsp:Transcript_18131/g.25144  ORF Transcript_18131/g.25144 Transcript_18131/m.25144 type:complete len:296 (+) Transcript_18131:157-1044(+)
MNNKSRNNVLQRNLSLFILLPLLVVILLPNNNCLSLSVVNAFNAHVVTTTTTTTTSPKSLYHQHLFSNHNILPLTRTSPSLKLSSSTSNEHTNDDTTTTSKQPIRKVVLLLPSSIDTTTTTTKSVSFQSSSSSYSPLSLEEAVKEIMESTTDSTTDGYNSLQITSTQCQFFPKDEYEVVEQTCRNANVLIALEPTSPSDVKFVATMFRLRRTAATDTAPSTTEHRRYQCQFALGGKPFAPLVGYYDAANPQPLLEDYVPFTKQAKSKQTATRMQELFDQWTIQSFREALLVFFNQ